MAFSSEGVRLVSFEAGAAEKVGGRDAKVVTYIVAGLPGTDYHVTLWIDAQTSLPLKRVIVPIVGEQPKQPHPRKAPIRMTNRRSTTATSTATMITSSCFSPTAWATTRVAPGSNVWASA